jgi:hypothetical protein
MSSHALRDEPTVTVDRKKLSTLEGPNGSTPSGSAGSVGAPSVGGGRKSAPLPTATQFEPLRGCDADRASLGVKAFYSTGAKLKIALRRGYSSFSADLAMFDEGTGVQFG